MIQLDSTWTFIFSIVHYKYSRAYYNIMQSLTELAPEYLTNLAKLDELLRHYQIVRQAEKFQ